MGRSLAQAALSALITAGLAAAAGPGYETFVFPRGLFRCETPSGWERTVDAEAGRLALTLPEPGAAGAREVELDAAYYRNGGSYASAGEFVKANGGERSRPAKLGGGLAARRYEVTTTLDDPERGPLRTRQAYAVASLRDGFFVLALTVRDRPSAGPGAWRKYLPVFERLAASFKPGAGLRPK